MFLLNREIQQLWKPIAIATWIEVTSGWRRVKVVDAELIDGFLGTNEEDAKELLAMSLQSFGLIEVVIYAPKELWIQALNAAYPEENHSIE
jgi:hypothetical protein